MDNCESVKELLGSYVAHTLTEEETSNVEEHLCVCDDCRKILNVSLDKEPVASSKGAEEEPNLYFDPKEAPRKSVRKIDIFPYLTIFIAVALLATLLWLILK